MNVIARATGIILRPHEEWRVVAGEAGTPGGVIRDYAVPLAAIPALAGLVGALLLSAASPLLRIRPVTALLGAVVTYVLSLVGVLVSAKLIEFLAPRFGGTADPLRATQLAVYSATASWLAGIFLAVPFLGFLGILGLYSLYLLWTGVPPVTRVPEDRRLVFTLALMGLAIVVNLLIATVTGLLLSL